MVHIFVINSKIAPENFSSELRHKLSKYTDLEYHVFNTSGAGMEEDIVRRMIRYFEGQTIRFYCCGGSGTLRNMLQGALGNNQVEFAFCPLGGTNDFLKVFGDQIEMFKDIDKLIRGQRIKVDYISTNYGCALNTVSFGLDTHLVDTLERVQDYNIFGRTVPFFMAYTHAILGVKSKPIIFSIDSHVSQHNTSEFIIGNGNTLGGQLHYTDEANIFDGELDFLAAVDKGIVPMVSLLSHMMKNEILEIRNKTFNGKCSSVRVKSVDGSEMAFNLDGEIVRGGNDWQIDVVNKGLNLIIPREVTIDN